MFNRLFLIISVKSFFAAGKFKKRRNKDENNKKHVALQHFYSWFEDSQALERLMNMVRKRNMKEVGKKRIMAVGKARKNKMIEVENVRKMRKK